jgi:geranylgeranyl diphosphate synthase type I
MVAMIRRYVFTGGKRIRPVLCYWGWRGAGGADVPGIINAAASLELFHCFGLIHDDIMDGSDTRRGEPTLHRQLAALHAKENWHGDPELFGTGAALTAGDWCLFLSDQLFHDCGLAHRRISSARALLTTMRTEVAAGQYLDVVEAARRIFSPSVAEKIIRYKSGKYSVERPLQIGGLLAGASPALIEAYSAFGVPLGEAFQLRDDILGAVGDPADTGKSDLDDFREGKPTWLMALAWQHATDSQRTVIAARHGDTALDEAGADELRAVLAATGALAAIEKLIAERTATALAALERAPITPRASTALAEIADAIVHRRI